MINTSSVSMSSYHQNNFAHHYMTPTRTRRGMSAAVASSETGLSKTPSPTVGRSRINTQQRQQPRPATSDFLFSIEYDFFLKNLVGIDQAGSPPGGGHRSMPRKGELFHSVSYSPQPMPKMFGNNRPQSTMAGVVSSPHYSNFNLHQHKPSHSLSSSASSSTSSPARKPQLHAFPTHESVISNYDDEEDKMKIKNDEKIKPNRRTLLEDNNEEIDGMEAENLSHQHLHALHRFRRQREKGYRSQLRDIVISFTPKARGSILNRDQFFIRFGLEEQKALACFDFLQAELFGEDDCDKNDLDHDDIDASDELDILEDAASRPETIPVPVDQSRRLSFSKSRSLENVKTSRDSGPTTSNSFDQGQDRKVTPDRSSQKSKKKTRRRIFCQG